METSPIPTYDTKEGIEASLSSLVLFNALIEARYEAGYKRNERLSEWIVLGRFILDSCGNFMKIINDRDIHIVPADKYPNFPKVLSQEELWQFIESRKEDPTEYLTVCSTPSWLPPAKQICPVCHHSWTVANCHDLVDTRKSKVTNLTPFIGQTIGEFKTKWNQSPQVVWSIQPGRSLQNKKYIDRSICQDSDWCRQNKVRVNPLGWVNTDNQHLIEPGDKLLVNVWTLRHEKCFRKRQAEREYKYFRRIFRRAGFQNISMTAIPNQYHGSNCHSCGPWYEVKADQLKFIIGWRKRVISIELVNRPNIDLDILFSKESVTKGSNYIHAWGGKKCVAYLQAIRQFDLVNP